MHLCQTVSLCVFLCVCEKHSLNITPGCSYIGFETEKCALILAGVMKSVIDVSLPTLIKLVDKSLGEGSMEGVKSSVIDPLLKKAGLDADTDK